MPTDIPTVVSAWQVVAPLLPAEVNAAITQRVSRWQQPKVRQNTPAATAQPVLLVMRPGTIPRPIDPFFFEITNR